MMRQFMICIMFLLYTNTVLAQRTPACCDDADCPMVVCVHAACIAQSPVAPLAAMPVPLLKQQQDFPADIEQGLPIAVNQVWTPPD